MTDFDSWWAYTM